MKLWSKLNLVVGIMENFKYLEKIQFKRKLLYRLDDKLLLTDE
jgi:hypothetical protein